MDSGAGGQNPLAAGSPLASQLGSIGFDSGFEPDYYLEFSVGGGLANSFFRAASYGTIPTGGGGSLGTLSSLGSGGNAGASAGVTAGVEWAIPGNQFFTFCLGPTAARRATWGSVKSVYR